MDFRCPRLTLAAAMILAAGAAQAQNVSHGSSLYHQTCITCHGLPPVGGPELAPNNPALIASAIGPAGINIPQMSFLRGVYTSSDLADIAAYIASLQAAPPPPPPPAMPQFDYSDLWWNPNESGWGFNIIQHGTGVLFCVMFTYGPGNVPMWYVVPGGTWNTTTNFSGAVYRVSGTAVNQPFVGSAATNVGNATIIFTDQNNASLTMTVNGTQVIKQIQRQPF